MMQIEALGQVEAVYNSIVRGYNPYELPEAWKDWIAQVSPLVPDIPPPTTPPIRKTNGEYGPPPEWMDWLRAASKRVPHIPPPEEIPKKRSRLVYVAVILALIYVAKKL